MKTAKKTVVTFSLLAAANLFPLSGLAANSHDAGHAGMPAKSTAAVRMTDGLIKKIDKAAGKVTVAHGPLENLGMPAMTMIFSVADANVLSRIKEGDRIRFMADNVNGALTIVHLEPAK